MPDEHNEDSFRARLARSVITEPLLSKINATPDEIHQIIIVANLEYRGGREAAFARIRQLADRAISQHAAEAEQGIAVPREGSTHGNLFGRLNGHAIRVLVALDRAEDTNEIFRPGQGASPSSAIYQIWEDTQVRPLITRSVATVKADAAHIAFSARGRDITWAIMDSGIDGRHGHFEKYRNLDLAPPLKHENFTSNSAADPLTDAFGHGTHVAGIVAGAMDAENHPLCGGPSSR